jgi:putative transposase
VKRSVTELEAENARLRKELASTKLDLEIVKKATSVPICCATTPARRPSSTSLPGDRRRVRESKHSWRDLLHQLKERGLSVPPKLAVGDGALGFWAALSEVFSTTTAQRWVHKMANVLNYLPKSVQPGVDPLSWTVEGLVC